MIGISANVFAALILMAVVSTALAMPLARMMLGREHLARQDDRLLASSGP